MISRLRAFLEDRRGNVAIIFAFVLPVLLLIAGLAVDYAVAVHRKLSLDAALDSAILAGARAAAEARSAGQSDWREIGNATITKMFRANVPKETNYETLGFTPKIELDGAEIKATATYTARSFTSFMSIFDKDNVDFGSTAQAQLSAANYVDVSFLIDNSASMGIGADVASQNKMIAAKGCALACHQPDGSTPTITAQQAHNVGATLRIDVIRDGTIAAINDLQAKVQGKAGRLRIGLYTFSNGLVTLKAPTTDIPSVLAAANTIGLNGSSGGGGTFIGLALQALHAQLPRGGSGASQSDRLSFIVLFSDGIEDSARMIKNAAGPNHYLDASIKTSAPSQNWWTNAPLKMPANTWMQAFSTTFCDRIKTTGNHSLLAIRVRYMVAPGLSTNPSVKYATETLPPYLQQSFSSCVSKPEYYITAGTTDEIKPAFLRIADKIVSAKGVALSQ